MSKLGGGVNQRDVRWGRASRSWALWVGWGVGMGGWALLIPHSNRTLTSRAGEGSECDLGRPTSSEGIDRKTKRTENSLSWREATDTTLGRQTARLS